MTQTSPLPSLGVVTRRRFPEKWNRGDRNRGAKTPARPGLAADLALSHRLTADPRANGAARGSAASVPGRRRPARRSRAARPPPGSPSPAADPEPRSPATRTAAPELPARGRFCVSAARAARLGAAEGKARAGWDERAPSPRRPGLAAVPGPPGAPPGRRRSRLRDAEGGGGRWSAPAPGGTGELIVGVRPRFSAKKSNGTAGEENGEIPRLEFHGSPLS